MSDRRSIRKVIAGTPKVDGAGVKLQRVFGYNEVTEFDPFLLLDSFNSKNPDDYIKGFPWHPHRGIETITYLVSGVIEHGDSLGNKGNILEGDCQWMTAGSGIIHQEMPKPSDQIFGVQLWLNLPARDKMTKPTYRDIKKDRIPVIEELNCEIKIISGIYKGNLGAIQPSFVNVLFLDVELKENSEWEIETVEDSTLVVYVLKGMGNFDSSKNEATSENRVVLFNKGKSLRVKASTEGVRFLLFQGAPLNETISWGGPIVMNTKEELSQAFKDIEEGKFIK